MNVLNSYDAYCQIDAQVADGDPKLSESGDALEVAMDLMKMEMPKPKKPSTPREPNPEMIMYWDFEAGDVRNFNANQLRGIYVPEEENNEN